MPVYTIDQPSTLNLRNGDSPGIVVSYTFQPGTDCPDNCPRVTSPATDEPPELYPVEILSNLGAIKEWMKRAELLNGYAPKAILETYLASEVKLKKNGKLVVEYTAGMRDELDPDALATSPAALIFKRVWDPADNGITTESRGEFDISYPAFQQLIEVQEHFLQVIGQLTAG